MFNANSISVTPESGYSLAILSPRWSEEWCGMGTSWRQAELFPRGWVVCPYLAQICPSVVSPIRTLEGMLICPCHWAPIPWPRTPSLLLPPADHPQAVSHSSLPAVPQRCQEMSHQLRDAEPSGCCSPFHNPPLSPLLSPAAEPPAEALPRLTPAPPALEMIHFPHGNFYYLLIFPDLFQLAPFLSGVTRNHRL